MAVTAEKNPASKALDQVKPVVATNGSDKKDQVKMSPVVKELETGRKDTTAVLRQDGTITVTCGYQGLQKKTITAYPMQWAALAKVLPEIAKCFSV
jgi:hypothetical protein